jgi:hypothetical protein
VHWNEHIDHRDVASFPVKYSCLTKRAHGYIFLCNFAAGQQGQALQWVQSHVTTRVFEDDAACDEYIDLLARLTRLQPTGCVAGHGQLNGELHGKECLVTLARLAVSLWSSIYDPA